jgi:hypothetical protein
MTQYLISVSHDTAESPTMENMDPAVIQPIFEAPDLDAALTWAAEGSKVCAGRVEVRPFQEEPA